MVIINKKKTTQYKESIGKDPKKLEPIVLLVGMQNSAVTKKTSGSSKK